MKYFWRLIYVIYPPLLRVLEKFKIHSHRQDYLLGTLNRKYSVDNLRAHLVSQDFEVAILAWRDPGEVLSLRKIEGDIFQYHIRLFSDGEIRCHYEYSSEGNPWGHIHEAVFEERREIFMKILGEYLS